jgi:hypothetical protein
MVLLDPTVDAVLVEGVVAGTHLDLAIIRLHTI